MLCDLPLRSAYRQVETLNAEGKCSVAIRMKIQWCRNMKWMEGLEMKNVKNMNMLQLIEDLEKPACIELGEPEKPQVAVTVPDLHAAMWRTHDLPIDWHAQHMKKFADEHAAYLKMYEEDVQKQVEGHADVVEDNWGNPSHEDWVQYVQNKLQKRAGEKKED